VAPYKVTTLAVPRDARTALDELAAAEGTTVSALMRGAAGKRLREGRET
jgi:hypothetical protein